MHKDYESNCSSMTGTIGLLLEKVPDTRGRYQRCGLFGEELDGQTFLLDANSATLSELEYEERHEDGSRTISIT